MIRLLIDEVKLACVLREPVAVIDLQLRLEEAVVKHLEQLSNQFGAHEHFGRLLLDAVQHLVLEVFEMDQLAGIAAISHDLVYNLILKTIKLHQLFVQSLNCLLLVCIDVSGEGVLAEEHEAQHSQCTLDVPRVDVIDVVPRERDIRFLEVRNHV